MTAIERCDTLIVGSGPAGCVLARRLTEDGHRQVVLLEAGPDFGPDPSKWPTPMRDPTNVCAELFDWGHRHTGRPDHDPLDLNRTRAVGGTSSVNGCVWLRGSAADYDGWAAAGNPGWSYEELLPYFLKSESDPAGGPHHGDSGPVPVSRASDANLTPADRAFIAAAASLGFPIVDDLNGDGVQRPMVGSAPKNVADGVRMNAAFTYLLPARQRPNLRLQSDAEVDCVLIEVGRAVGVRLIDGREITADEVVLSAGAYGTPAILLRSGIGPGTDLRSLGIPVIADRPGVGANLRDHPLVNGLLECAVASGHEPAGRTFIPIVIKARGEQETPEIDLHIYTGQWFDEQSGGWRFWFSASLQDARSTGRVRITSADPRAPLAIDHAYLSDPRDLEAICDGVELVNRLAATPPLASVITPAPGKGITWRDREELRRKAQANAGTTYHPSSSCKMGPATDPTAVVDHEGRVHGIAGFRVADASIFPTGPRANLHCTIVAAAEKIADAIRTGT